MPTKLEQVTALANGQRSVQAITLDDLPTLEGPRPDQIQRFNEGLKEWKRRTEVRLSEQMVQPTQS
jgi:hypothetical protein